MEPEDKQRAEKGSLQKVSLSRKYFIFLKAVTGSVRRDEPRMTVWLGQAEGGWLGLFPPTCCGGCLCSQLLSPGAVSTQRCPGSRRGPPSQWCSSPGSFPGSPELPLRRDHKPRDSSNKHLCLHTYPGWWQVQRLQEVAVTHTWTGSRRPPSSSMILSTFHDQSHSKWETW